MLFRVWLILTFVGSVSRGLLRSYQKHLTTDYDGLKLSYITGVFATIALLPVGIWSFLNGDLTASITVWVAVVVSSLLNIGGLVSWVKAVECDDVSAVSPLASLSPFLVVLVEPLFLSADWTLDILLGGALVAVGTMALLIDEGTISYLRHRITTIGPLFAFSSSAFYTATTILDKFVTNTFSPLMLTFLINAIIAIGLWVVHYAKGNRVATNQTDLIDYRFGVIGVLQGATVLCFITAFKFADTASQVKIASTLALVIDVALGYYFFDEDHILKRMVGALLIFAGIAFVL